MKYSILLLEIHSILYAILYVIKYVTPPFRKVMTLLLKTSAILVVLFFKL